MPPTIQNLNHQMRVHPGYHRGYRGDTQEKDPMRKKTTIREIITTDHPLIEALISRREIEKTFEKTTRETR